MRIQSTKRIPLTMFLALAATTTASCARVEAEVPETKVTEKAVQFQAVPGGQSLGEISITQSFTLTADDLSWAHNLNTEVYAYEVELKAVSGVEDLSFIHYARVTMSDGSKDSTTEPIEVINYTRPDNFEPSPILDVKTTYPINVTSAWAAKRVTITMELAGIFPEQDWAVDVTVHMSGKISYKF
jgi:hypothetical protein